MKESIILALVMSLNHENYKIRESSQVQLMKMGDEAALIARVVGGNYKNDYEIRRRCEIIWENYLVKKRPTEEFPRITFHPDFFKKKIYEEYIPAHVLANNLSMMDDWMKTPTYNWFYKETLTKGRNLIEVLNELEEMKEAEKLFFLWLYSGEDNEP